MRLSGRAMAAVLVYLGVVPAARAQSIVVTPPVLVHRASDSVLVEPQLARHPAAPGHFLGVAIIGPSRGSTEHRVGGLRCVAFVSRDTGRSWRRHDFPVTRCMDPWVAITPSGEAVAVAMGSHASIPGHGIVAFGSKDAGTTWDTMPQGLGSGDHPTVAASRDSSGGFDGFYLLSNRWHRASSGAWRQSAFVARTGGDRRTFGAPVMIKANNLAKSSEMPAVLSDGTLFVSFVERARLVDSAGTEVPFNPRRAWLTSSTDGGRTFGEPLLITDECGQPPHFQLSAMAVSALSSAFPARLFFACRKMGGGAIVVVTSADRGETWSPPRQLAEMTSDSTVLRHPVLSVNGAGTLAAAWMTVRYREDQRCQQLQITASVDGGRSYLAPRFVGGEACVPKDASALVYEWWPGSGDYFGLESLPDGAFQLIWGEPGEGFGSLWTARVRVGQPPRGE